jgi:DNA polymerase III delta prime subunit
MPHTYFALPESKAAKASTDLIAADDAHFARLADRLSRRIAEVSDRLDELRSSGVRGGQAALERDLEVHSMTAELRMLRRFALDLCLGRIVGEAGEDPVYIGRIGLTDADGTPLLVDWRAPAAEPFFAATRARPMGVAARRRYRWNRGRVVDYWDEVFGDPGAGESGDAALDEDSALIASLGASRTEKMRDVLGTIQADQDEIIRASSRGPLVVDGGPGTGKTVVALHRAAYLLYADPQVEASRGGVLIVGPHRPYLAYVADVLPSLGEEGVLTCTLSDLVPEGEHARPEPDPRVARIKSSARWREAIDRGVRFYEEAPTEKLTLESAGGDVRVTARDWADAFDSFDIGAPHNEARSQVWDALVERLAKKGNDAGREFELVSAEYARSEDLHRIFNHAWPSLDPTNVVEDMFSVPAYLKLCAPWLSREEVALLQRENPREWTREDLPLLDAARARVGDPGAERRRREREAADRAQRAEMEKVVDELMDADDSELGLMKSLRHGDLRDALVDQAALPAERRNRMDGPFSHVIVDEAQELSDAEWQVLLQRCPSRSFTVVGDRAQARAGFSETWAERLDRVGLRDARTASLKFNYRTPSEVMNEAAPVIRAALPDANVPESVRSSGIPVRRGSVAEGPEILAGWLRDNDEGVACVIDATDVETSFAADTPRVSVLDPVSAKGLEFDLVVLVRPEEFGEGVAGAVDRYVAMTRSTQQLVILA